MAPVRVVRRSSATTARKPGAPVWVKVRHHVGKVRFGRTRERRKGQSSSKMQPGPWCATVLERFAAGLDAREEEVQEQQQAAASAKVCHCVGGWVQKRRRGQSSSELLGQHNTCLGMRLQSCRWRSRPPKATPRTGAVAAPPGGTAQRQAALMRSTNRTASIRTRSNEQQARRLLAARATTQGAHALQHHITAVNDFAAILFQSPGAEEGGALRESVQAVGGSYMTCNFVEERFDRRSSSGSVVLTRLCT